MIIVGRLFTPDILNCTQLQTHRVAIELKLSTRMRSSSSLLEIVFVTDTVQLYMIGSAWEYKIIIMMKVIKMIMIMIMMIRRVVKKNGYFMVRLKGNVLMLQISADSLRD